MSKTKHIKILILAVGKRLEVKMVTWIPPYLPAQQAEKGNKKRPQFFSPLVDTLNLLSYNLLDGCFWHRIPSCLSFCIRDSELPRYIHLDFIFPDTRIPDPVLKVLPASDAEFFSKKLLTDLDFFSFFLSTSASEALLHRYEETRIRLSSQVQLQEIIFSGIVVDSRSALLFQENQYVKRIDITVKFGMGLHLYNVTRWPSGKSFSKFLR